MQRKLPQDRLEFLVIPEVEVAFDAGEMLENLGSVWQNARLDEKNGPLVSMLEALYVDLANSKSAVGIVPRAPFYPLYESLLDRHEPRVRMFRPDGGPEGSPPLAGGGEEI